MNTAVQSLTVLVADVRAEAKDVITLELRAIAGGELPEFTPGAHLDVHLPNGLVRNYSLTNDWRERNRYIVGVGRAADSRGGSSYIHSSVRAGQQIKISAPRNNFPLDEASASFLFIAGGIGVTPFRSMIKYLLDTKQRRDITLIYAVRSSEDIAYQDVFDAAQTQLDAKIYYLVGEPNAKPPFYTARIDAASLKRLAPNTDSLFYISGPHDMVVDTEHALRENGVPRPHIKKDFFSGYA